MFEIYCKNLILYMHLYKHQVEYNRNTVYDILENDIGMILPKFESRGPGYRLRKQKRQIILAILSRFIGLAYEGISGFFTS